MQPVPSRYPLSSDSHDRLIEPLASFNGKCLAALEELSACGKNTYTLFKEWTETSDFDVCAGVARGWKA